MDTKKKDSQMKKLLFTTSLILLLIGNLQSITYYISSSGDDTNTGLTLIEAWATLSHAALASSPVRPGDIVYIEAGYY